MAGKKVGSKHDNSSLPRVVAETDTISDSSMSQVQYFDVLAGDRVGKAATLWSVGTTNIGSNGWTTHDGIRMPSELVARDKAHGVDNGTYKSALGANIFITSSGEVGYDMSGMSAATRLQIDDLAVGQSVTDSFYYAVELGSGALRWNEVSVVINGAAATINAGQGSVVENRNVDGNGNLTDTEALTVRAASGDAAPFTIAPTNGATLGTVMLNGATLNADGSYTLAGGTGTFTYAVSNAAVQASGLGYGESQKEWFTITTANGTTASFFETVDGNINAPVVTAAAAQSSITQGSSDGLTISALDGDNNASLSYAITGVPTGATLASAADPGGVSYDGNSQSWAVAPGALGDLTLTPAAGFSGQIELSVLVTNTEVNPSNAADVATLATTATIDIDVTAAADPPTLTAALLDVPGAYQTEATAINDAGLVAGYYVDSAGQHGFIYDAGSYTTLDPTNGASTVVTGINNAGEVVGYYRDATGVHGFTFEGGGYQLINASDSLHFGVYSTQITAVDGDGDVGGYYQDATGEHGFVIDQASGVVTPLDEPQGAGQTYVTALTDSGEVVGYYNDSTGETHGFIYQNGGYQTLDPPGSDYTAATGVNAAGDVVGNYQEGFNSYGFLYDGSNFTTISGPSGAAGAQVSAINSLGQVAGFYYDSAGDTHSFVYADGSYTTALGPPNAYSVNATAINDSGAVVGNATTPSEMSFVYNVGNGTYSALPAPDGAQAAYATAVNDSGAIAGDYTSNAGQYGFLYDPGTGAYTTLTVSADAYDSYALGINNSGEVVGYYDDTSGEYGFTYAAGNYATLTPTGATGSYGSAINGNGDVAGYFQDSAGSHGFVYTAATATYTTLDDPAGVGSTYATGLNDSGTVVGYYDDSNGGEHGFVYQNGGYTTLDVPAASWTQPIAVNDAGAVLGYYGNSNGQYVFVFQNDAVTTLAALPTQSTVAAGFNSSGDVVGSYWDSAGQHGFLYDPGTQQYTTLNEPAGNLGTAAYAVNNTGEIVGGYSPIYQHGFLAVPT